MSSFFTLSLHNINVSIIMLVYCKDVGDDDTGCINVERRRSSSSTSSVLSTSPPRQTVTSSVTPVSTSVPQTSAPPGGRGFDLLALQEAISLATASTLRFGPPPPPPGVGEILHYGTGLRGFSAPSSTAGLPRPPGWVFPSSASRYDLAGQPLEVKAAGYAAHQMRDGRPSRSTIGCLSNIWAAYL